MSSPLPVVEFTESFLNSLHSVDDYYQKRNPARGQQFVRDLFDLIYEVAVPFARAQPLFEPLCRRLPGREFRKLIFRRQYLAVYEVLPARLHFVLFRHGSHNLDSGLNELLEDLN